MTSVLVYSCFIACLLPKRVATDFPSPEAAFLVTKLKPRLSCRQQALNEFPCWGCNLITLSSPESKIPRYPQAVRFTLVIQCQQDNMDGGFVIDCDWSGSSFERNDLQPCSDLSRISGLIRNSCHPMEIVGNLEWPKLQEHSTEWQMSTPLSYDIQISPTAGLQTNHDLLDSLAATKNRQLRIVKSGHLCRRVDSSQIIILPLGRSKEVFFCVDSSWFIQVVSLCIIIDKLANKPDICSLCSSWRTKNDMRTFVKMSTVGTRGECCKSLICWSLDWKASVHSECVDFSLALNEDSLLASLGVEWS